MEVLANVRRALHVSDAALGYLAPSLGLSAHLLAAVKVKTACKIKQTAARLKNVILGTNFG